MTVSIDGPDPTAADPQTFGMFVESEQRVHFYRNGERTATADPSYSYPVEPDSVMMLGCFNFVGIRTPRFEAATDPPEVPGRTVLFEDHFTDLSNWQPGVNGSMGAGQNFEIDPAGTLFVRGAGDVNGSGIWRPQPAGARYFQFDACYGNGPPNTSDWIMIIANRPYSARMAHVTDYQSIVYGHHMFLRESGEQVLLFATRITASGFFVGRVGIGNGGGIA